MVDVLLPALRLRRTFMRHMVVEAHLSPAVAAGEALTTPRANTISSNGKTTTADLEAVAAELLLSTPAIARRWKGSPSCPPRNLAQCFDEC